MCLSLIHDTDLYSFHNIMIESEIIPDERIYVLNTTVDAYRANYGKYAAVDTPLEYREYIIWGYESSLGNAQTYIEYFEGTNKTKINLWNKRGQEIEQSWDLVDGKWVQIQ